MVERRFSRNLGSLEPMAKFVADYVGSRGFDPEHSFTADLLIEEVFTNMLRHGKGGGAEVVAAWGAAVAGVVVCTAVVVPLVVVPPEPAEELPELPEYP